MQKILLIIGPPECGKTWMARQIAEDYKKDEVTWIVGKNIRANHPFNFQDCEPTTKLLIIDDLPSVEKLEGLYHTVNGITVDKQLHKAFTLNPRIIITSSAITSDQVPHDESFKHRFDVLDMKSFNTF